jgi:hypothetical protein
MLIVVNNKDKDGGHLHDEEEDVEGQKMPAQPHRKVIIKATDNQSEPEGGGDRRESSSSWASCEDTPGESQISHES